MRKEYGWMSITAFCFVDEMFFLFFFSFPFCLWLQIRKEKKRILWGRGGWVFLLCDYKFRRGKKSNIVCLWGWRVGSNVRRRWGCKHLDTSSSENMFPGKLYLFIHFLRNMNFFLSPVLLFPSHSHCLPCQHMPFHIVFVFAIVHLFYSFLLVLSTGHDVWWFGVCNRVASCKCLTWVQKPWRHASMHTMTPSGLSAWPQKTRWVCCEFQVSVHMEHS